MDLKERLAIIEKKAKNNKEKAAEKEKSVKIEYLGIVEGGACGIWDFYTNGTKTFLKHEENGSIKGAELKYLNDFLNEFDIFEKAFYKWVDSLAD